MWAGGGGSGAQHGPLGQAHPARPPAPLGCCLPQALRPLRAVRARWGGWVSAPQPRPCLVAAAAPALSSPVRRCGRAAYQRGRRWGLLGGRLPEGLSDPRQAPGRPPDVVWGWGSCAAGRPGQPGCQWMASCTLVWPPPWQSCRPPLPLLPSAACTRLSLLWQWDGPVPRAGGHPDACPPCSFSSSELGLPVHGRQIVERSQGLLALALTSVLQGQFPQLSLVEGVGLATGPRPGWAPGC